MRVFGGVQVEKEADADIVVIPYWVDLHCRMSQESELLWDEFNRVCACHLCELPHRATAQMTPSHLFLPWLC